MFRWPHHVADASPSLVTAAMATSMLLSVVDLGALVWMLRGLRDVEENRARYAKLQLEEDVEQGKKVRRDSPRLRPSDCVLLASLASPVFMDLPTTSALLVSADATSHVPSTSYNFLIEPGRFGADSADGR